MQEVVEIFGIVTHGKALGRTLGYPTANVELGECKRSWYGVFLSEVFIKGERHFGVLSIGENRTVKSDSRVVAECYILDYSGNLYGSEITFRAIAKIREQQRFDTIELLQEQIQRDVETAKGLVELLIDSN